jgi:hypothetical protein
VPRVYYRLDDGAFVELALGKDFALSYVNNVNPGKAVITIHGRGEYRGQYTVTFMVVES